MCQSLDVLGEQVYFAGISLKGRFGREVLFDGRFGRETEDHFVCEEMCSRLSFAWLQVVTCTVQDFGTTNKIPQC